MAINKKSTPMWVKGVIVVVALSFIALPVIGAIGSGGAFGGGTAQSAQGTYEQIAQKHAGAIEAYDQMLASEPTSYTVLVNQANKYYDWAWDVMQVPQLQQTGSDKPLWLAATSYYKRALEAGDLDPAVGTDLAISQYYAGQTADAIAAVENVIKVKPDFAPARFNAGIFYTDAGQADKAIAAYEKYLELDPQNTVGNVDAARQNLQKLQSSAPTSATPLGQ